jgi:hypothetical protein
MLVLIAAAAIGAAEVSPLPPPGKGVEQVQPPILRQPPGGVPPLMPIYGVSAGGQGVTVQLPANGCNLTKSDFTVAISRSAERPTVLIARRRGAGSPVLCKGQPRVDITWSYADLGLSAGQPFSVANPLVMAP